MTQVTGSQKTDVAFGRCWGEEGISPLLQSAGHEVEGMLRFERNWVKSLGSKQDEEG